MGINGKSSGGCSFFCVVFLVVVFLVVVGGESSHVNVGRGFGQV